MKNHEPFVRAWQRSSSVAEVARSLQKKQDDVRSIAAWLRRRGVPLKKYAPGRKRVDVKRLARVAKEALR